MTTEQKKIELPELDQRAAESVKYWKNDRTGAGVVCTIQSMLHCRERQLIAALTRIEELKRLIVEMSDYVPSTESAPTASESDTLLDIWVGIKEALKERT
jgi:hypothetical protein